MLCETMLNIIFCKSLIGECNKSQMDKSISDYELYLDKCNAVGELKNAIRLNMRHNALPSYLVVASFEKYLLFERSDADVLQIYANYLIKYVPEWGYYAGILLDEARRIRSKNCRRK
jgi:hypothetical protein